MSKKATTGLSKPILGDVVAKPAHCGVRPPHGGTWRCTLDRLLLCHVSL